MCLHHSAPVPSFSPCLSHTSPYLFNSMSCILSLYSFLRLSFASFIYFVLHISCPFTQPIRQRQWPSVTTSVFPWLMTCTTRGRCFKVWCRGHLGIMPDMLTCMKEKPPCTVYTVKQWVFFFMNEIWKHKLNDGCIIMDESILVY